MIQPGTVCMIRGVPQSKNGCEFNGTIVRALDIKKVLENVGNIWHINPRLTAKNGKHYTGCAEQWLHPLDDFEDELNREALDEVLERTFRETLERELDKSK